MHYIREESNLMTGVVYSTVKWNISNIVVTLYCYGIFRLKPSCASFSCHMNTTDYL